MNNEILKQIEKQERISDFEPTIKKLHTLYMHFGYSVSTLEKLFDRLANELKRFIDKQTTQAVKAIESEDYEKVGRPLKIIKSAESIFSQYFEINLEDVYEGLCN